MRELLWHSGDEPIIALVERTIRSLYEAEQAATIQATLFFAQELCRLEGAPFDAIECLENPEAWLQLLDELRLKIERLDRMCEPAHRQHLEILLIANNIDYKALSLDKAMLVEMCLDMRGEYSYYARRVREERIAAANKAVEGLDASDFLASFSDEDAVRMLSPEKQELRLKILAERKAEGV